MNIPQNVKLIFDIVNNAGFNIYLVGGCVRDAIMGIEPHDYDFTTNALPSDIVELFKDYTCNLVGVKYGTVAVVIDNEQYEITTHRVENKYEDNRHPEEISFSTSLAEDLARRDFTINAIAYSPSEGYIDLYEGIQDIKNKVIRTVNAPQDRFSEDALRIIRAIRFAAKFGFEIDVETEKQMFLLKETIKHISKERYHSEFIKIFESKYATKILEKYWNIIFVEYEDFLKFDGFDQKNKYHIYDLKMHTIKAIEAYDGNDTLVKIALLFHDIGKIHTQTVGKDKQCHYYNHPSVSEEMATTILKNMRFSTNEIDTIVKYVKYHDAQLLADKKALKKWVIRFGEKGLYELINVAISDAKAQNPELSFVRAENLIKVRELIPEVIENLNVFSVKDLAVSGRDILSLGIAAGPLVGQIQKEVFDMVLNEQLENNKDVLIEYIKKNYA